MELYLAPMEGITGFVFRNAYKKYFDGVDKYFSPFISPSECRHLKSKALRDVLPEKNAGIDLIPQILTNDSAAFIATADRLKDLGYSEINLNLGCPAGTVVAKFRGSGFLAKTDELDAFLEKIFRFVDLRISIKTRLGKDSPDEFRKLIKIYNRYPLSELIIHPRIQKDYYRNQPDWSVFGWALENSVHSVCYNGDIFTVSDLIRLKTAFPSVTKVMLGRGLLANPGLAGLIRQEAGMGKPILRKFHDEILKNYIDLFKDERNAMFRMKELWGFMAHSFADHAKYAKLIRKSSKMDEYLDVVESLFAEQDILHDAGLILMS